MFKKCASYLTPALLILPLVANATGERLLANNDMRPWLNGAEHLCTSWSKRLDDDARRLLEDFYQQRDGQPAWQSVLQWQQLKAEVAQLADDGLQPDDYPLPDWQDGARQAPCNELLISHAYLQALSHLRQGRLSQQRLEPLWRASAWPKTDTRQATLSIALHHVPAPSQAFGAARPDNPLYTRLRAAYAQVRQHPVGEWSAIPDGPLLRPGGNDPRLPALRARLAAEGYLTPLTTDLGNAFDPLTVDALKAFQAEHGINPDGILGQASLVELNVPAQLRRDQLWINLERLRWLVDDLREAEVTVNVAAAELRVIREGQVHWRTRTQVGRAERATPLLASYINRLTLNPTWTVPPTIFREDKLPEIRNDLAYLERSELSVLDPQGNALDPQTVDWENPGQVVLRQAASAHNPLGQVALRFSNPFSVYLHDTPSQLLFDKSPRVFSSGCVRVEAVDKLLTLLLPEDELQPVQERLATGKTQEYRLSPRAPLLIGYWTVEADADGTLRYAPDTYLHDPHLLRALQQAGH
ncbi:L,D-transpeptidase family protein [Pseudomonas sp.]|uniref:L,D-transpeptidase family protein n=1 Tax=Pseudomonas sp. TaxID=306 RepID=UPI003D0CAD95